MYNKKTLKSKVISFHLVLHHIIYISYIHVIIPVSIITIKSVHFWQFAIEHFTICIMKWIQSQKIYCNHKNYNSCTYFLFIVIYLYLLYIIYHHYFICIIVEINRFMTGKIYLQVLVLSNQTPARIDPATPDNIMVKPI